MCKKTGLYNFTPVIYISLFFFIGTSNIFSQGTNFTLSKFNYKNHYGNSDNLIAYFSNAVAAANDNLTYSDTPTGALRGLSLSITTINTICGHNNGIIVASASGGTPPYTYQSYAAQASDSSGIFLNLFPGTYDVTALDANGAKTTTTVTLTNTFSPPSIKLSSFAMPTGCATADGNLILSASGGLPPYMYSINDGINYQSNNIFTNLSSGSYNLFVKDANGCITTSWGQSGIPYNDATPYNNFSSYYIGSNCSLTLNISEISVITCGNDGFIQFFEALGGTPPYQYSIDGIHFEPNPALAYYYLAPGRYTIYAKDSEGLTTSESVDLIGFCFVSATTTEANCGKSDGSITVTIGNGIPPFSYSIDGTHFQTSNIFNDLPAGTYTIIVKDINRQTSAAAVTISENCPFVTAIATDASCNSNNGTITATGASGTSPYQYSIDETRFQTSNIFSGLAPANYTVTVKDANGLTNTTSVTIKNHCPVVTAISTDAICGNNNGTIIATAANGTPPYQYSIDGINFQMSNNFLDLGPRMYIVTIKDANGLTNTTTISVPIGTTPDIKVFAGNDTSVATNQPLQLFAIDVNNSGFIEFSWSPTYGLNNPSIQNPVAILDKDITYTVTAKTHDSCAGSGDINIKIYKGPDIFVPNAFTPNGDGRNDILKAMPVGIKEFRYFMIYNREGQKVFYTSNPSIGWDGRVGNSLQRTNSFVWMAEAVDYKGNVLKRKGTVLLIR
ncbi:MAG TPA: gliding motility-associated C-terminal domain-containing protein [Puia sp.]|nr:gliding motility-associated C-terminal domain-containing protein [Puia sp.]